jgi:ABC-type nitrate/sulfonate/bicarbonate transport system substrate-binding protein
MKATIVVFPLYLLVAILVTDNGGAAQERALRIGFPSVAFQELPLFAASKRGFFRAEGLNVELVQIAGSPAVAALLSGDVDYITHNSRIIATAARGGGVKSLFNYVAKPIYYLALCRRSSKPKSFRDARLAFHLLAALPITSPGSYWNFTV